MKTITFCLAISFASIANIFSQNNTSSIDYSKQKTLHVVGTAHFDTQWLWTIQTSINEYVPTTMTENFKLFEKYPDYKFSFEGAFKYMLMKEYYPADYAKVKEYIQKERWNVCGSSLDAGDVNIPSPEAIIRNILIGQTFYKKEFGKTSSDIFLPDCFGFGYTLPTISKHCGLKGFSTQKLTWGSAVGIPFDIGAWQGVDGSKILAELNPGDYNGDIKTDLSKETKWNSAIEKTAKNTNLNVAYSYFGVGDRGGAPREASVEWLQKSIKGSGPLKVISAPADLLCKQVTNDQLNKLPQYSGELLMSTHGTGFYTSQCAMKRWNRKNELLADAAERASVAASWLGSPYPKEKLNTAWTRFIWHQFHDDITGTSIPEAYNYSWNDELLSLNQFATITEDAVATVTQAIDTKVKGVPVVVYNPLSRVRQDVVEVEVEFAQAAKGVKVLDKTGEEVVSQVLTINVNKARVLFLAKVPPVGFEVYDVQPLNKPASVKNTMKINEQNIENSRYMVVIDVNGDVKRIVDKIEKHDLLSAPMRIQFLDDESTVYPAWEINYSTLTAKTRAYLDKPIRIQVMESGPLRSCLKIVREKDGSTFNQYIYLSEGAANHKIDFYTQVNWKTKGTLVKAMFPLSVSSSKATYDLGMGVIQRGNNTDKLYEVPAQQWADLSSPDGLYGVTIINDCKYGWDKPNDNTLRLTLFHTPKTAADYSFQANNDLGVHEFRYSLVGHKGTWQQVQSPWLAAEVNQPMLAFQTTVHEGKLGKSFSFASVNNEQVMIKAIKLAENGNDIVVRFQELNGQNINNVKLTLPSQVSVAKEVTGAEEFKGEARIVDGKLFFNMQPFEPKTFALTIGASNTPVTPKTSVVIPLEYNIDAVSSEANKTDGSIDAGLSFPAEQYPEKLNAEGVNFELGAKADGQKNMLACKGNVIILPAGNYNRVYMLVCAKNDSKAMFKVDNTESELFIPSYTGFIGQWENRVDGTDKLTPAYLKREQVAWNSTHMHNGVKNSNEAYKFGYLLKIAIDLPKDAKTIVLPNNENIYIAAMSVCNDANANTKAAQLLYDDLTRQADVAK
jgi:alpha-mannosidase